MRTEHGISAIFLLACVAPAACQVSEGNPLISKVEDNISSWYSTITAQPAIASVYAEVTAAVGGPASYSDIIHSLNAEISAAETQRVDRSQLQAKLTAWETVLPTSLRDTWDALQSSLAKEEASIIASVEASARQSTRAASRTGGISSSVIASPSITASSVATAAVNTAASSLTVYSGHAAPTNGPYVWGVAGGLMGMVGLVAAIL